MHQDPIADMLTRIRNANALHHESVSIPSSKIKLNIVKILLDEGFITSYKEVVTEEGHKNIEVVSELTFQPIESVEIGLNLVCSAMPVDLAHVNATLPNGKLEYGYSFRALRKKNSVDEISLNGRFVGIAA